MLPSPPHEPLPQWIDELRSRITLSSVIGRTVRILKAGREFKACCPFHGEKTPSFTINDEKGSTTASAAARMATSSAG
jgi:DNA primase